MNLQPIASLALKLLGIHTLILAMPYTQLLFMLSKQYRSLPLICGALSPILLLTGTGIALIAYSNRLAHTLVRENVAHSESSQAAPHDIQAIAFSVVGIYLFATALPKLVPLFLNIGLLHRAGYEGLAEKAVAEAWANGTGIVIQMALGLGLFFGDKGLVRIWHRLHPIRPIRPMK
jgi:hypothetical protein